MRSLKGAVALRQRATTAAALSQPSRCTVRCEFAPTRPILTRRVPHRAAGFGEIVHERRVANRDGR